MKVGDKVRTIQLGDCVVVRIVKSDTYPLKCENKSGVGKSYTLEGKFHWSDTHSSFIEPEFEERIMEVSDNEGFRGSGKALVIAILKGKYVTEFYSWKYAREVKMELTLQEIADKFNINVENLKIV